MAWNANVPATNADLLSAPLRENFQALNTALYAPLTAATDGYLLYRAAGPALAGESMLLYDAANNNLKLFGGGIGTSGQGVLALGPGIAPTTSPVDTVQLYAADYGAEAGSRGLFLRDERGGKIALATTANNYTFLEVRNPAGTISGSVSTDSVGLSLGCDVGSRLMLYITGHQWLLDTAGNTILPGAGVGANGARVLALGASTAPTTSPVDTVQLYTLDLAGQAGSRGLFLRDERGGKWSFASSSDSWTYMDLTAVDGKRLIFDVASGSCDLFAESNLTLLVAGGYGFTIHTTGAIYLAGLGTSTSRALSQGAPDSGGAGYRQLLIAN
jgi:hypothetical protein